MADLDRGYLLPRIEAVMDFLSEWHPPQYYPADGRRAETDAPQQWTRGGTSPSGENLGDVRVANWFVGETYLQASYAQPHRIVWLPPEPGQERFVTPDSAGYHPTHEQVSGEGPGRRTALGDRAFRRIFTRIVPTEADIWGNDYDDTDILVHWLTSAVFCTNAGAVEAAGETPVASGGYVPQEKNQRGLRYRLLCHFAFPVGAPWKEVHRGRSAGIGVRPESAAHAGLRGRERAEERHEGERRGRRFPHDLDRTPWRRTSIRNPAGGPTEEADPLDPTVDDGAGPSGEDGDLT